jgi:hypothetical protein
MSDHTFYTHTKQGVKNYSCYFNLYVLRHQAEKKQHITQNTELTEMPDFRLKRLNMVKTKYN